jgi:ATP-dependent DNA helicase RecG
MFDDRLRVINSGGLYGKISLSNLGKIRPDTRNAVLANILEILKITENRYSGIPTIQREMQDAGLPPAEFSVRHGEFFATLYNSVSQPKYTGKPDDILTFCATPRSRAELQEFTGKSHFYTMSHIVQPLIDSGALKLTIPEKPKSSKQRFVAS